MAIAKALFSSATGEWATPGSLFDQLNDEFDFTLDAAATSDNKVCPGFLGPGSPWGEDALAKEHWELHPPGSRRSRVWCNPPYGRGVGLWVTKAIDEAMHGNLVVMLLPARTDTKWFHQAAAAGAEIRFIKGRLHFGGCPSPAPFPSCVLIFRPHIEGLHEWVSM